MTDTNTQTAPERIWTIGSAKHHTATWITEPPVQPSMAIGVNEYVRADLFEAVKAERDSAQEAVRVLILEDK